MKLPVTVDGTEGTLELLRSASGCRFRWNNEAERAANVVAVEPGVYSVLLDGHSYEVRVEETPAGLQVVVNGRRFQVEIEDPRSWSRKSRAGRAEGVQPITAPMPGKVVRVLVAIGDAVEAGQGVVVVEAMKMQNELKALRAGIVLTVDAAEGATVTAGETLATLGGA